ncbi:hypothetical protein [Halorussus amylolyticus]|uniref:hypothetical protein n=1 Tax=Halorussus amylolyticus TaxID=1126242 RepID=UPI00138F175C|nr:hypothetical protein [Halorussus amylolyticus]
MSQRIRKTDDDDSDLSVTEQRVRDLLGDASSYIEDGEVRPMRERLSKSGGDEDGSN